MESDSDRSVGSMEFPGIAFAPLLVTSRPCRKSPPNKPATTPVPPAPQNLKFCLGEATLPHNQTAPKRHSCPLGIFQKAEADDRQLLEALLEAGATKVENHSVILSEEELREKYNKLLQGGQ